MAGVISRRAGVTIVARVLGMGGQVRWRWEELRRRSPGLDNGCVARAVVSVGENECKYGTTAAVCVSQQQVAALQQRAAAVQQMCR